MPPTAMPEYPAAPTATGSDFTPLLRQVREQGLLDRRVGRYLTSIGVNLALIAATVYAMFELGGSWWTLLLAPVLAVLTARSAFFGHDAGHQQISPNRRTNRLLGLAHGNLLAGLSNSWWIGKHNKHHANPNDVESDPDVEVGALVWTVQQSAERTRSAGWLTRHQARLFFPLLLLLAISMRVRSVRHLMTKPAGWRTETGLLVAHAVGYLFLMFGTMSPWMAVLFIGIHQAVLGLHLGCAFAPNHKGMPMPPPGHRWDHLRRQVLTARNVRGGPVTDYMLGGLNYQIEHHLFPSMPRPYLRFAQPVVRAHCARLGVPYAETSLVDSYSQALRHLHDVGEPLRASHEATRRLASDDF